MKRSADSITIIKSVRRRFQKIRPALDERGRRLWAATEADDIGRGGLAWVAEATGLARSTVVLGLREVRRGVSSDDVVNVRRRGAGRKSVETRQPRIRKALERLVAPSSSGDPERPLQWTTMSVAKLTSELKRQGFEVGQTTVRELLGSLGYSLQGNYRTKEGKDHPDRDAQFRHINDTVENCISRDVPVISVDTKKKELVGDYANAGKEWRPTGQPREVLTYDFPKGGELKAIPYGVYDVALNEGFVNVGSDHDTPTFATHSINRWWSLLGKQRYPNAKELFITADGGGSNSSRCHVWKVRLQQLADELGLIIHVSHFPPGTSKWNKIEHRLFSFISLNWRGQPLKTYETIVSLISGTATDAGLKVTAMLDRAKYPLGIRISKQAPEGLLNIKPHVFHGEWNYTLHPFSPQERAAAKARIVPVPSIRRHATVRAQWRELFIDQIRSGLSHGDYCRKHNINRTVYYQQRAKLIAPLRIRETISRERWLELFREHSRSGLTRTEFCQLHGLTYASFTGAYSKLIRARAKRSE